MVNISIMDKQDTYINGTLRDNILETIHDYILFEFIYNFFYLNIFWEKFGFYAI